MKPSDEKKPPEIMGEEDEPFDSDFDQGHEVKADKSLSKEIDAEREMNLKRFALGQNILGWCIALMFFCVILGCINPDNNIVSAGFDAFRLIVMTILGYIFGSNSKS